VLFTWNHLWVLQLQNDYYFFLFGVRIITI